MLIRFSFKNYKSLKENEYNIAKAENEDYLKIVAIYGAKTSGKTNVLQEFCYMKKKVLVSAD